MLFNSLQYGVFFVVVFTLHWCMPLSWRRPFLLVASYYFYASAIPQYLLLILGLTVFNYGMGRWLGASAGRARTLALWLMIVGNLGSLAYFKYTQFILSSLQPLLQHAPLISASFNDSLLVNILLPLGISFFTFEFIHYGVEVYKGREPMRNPIDFALFAAFFPTQIAGPIKRFPDFVKQIAHPIPLRDVDIDHGIWLILRGLLKKVVVADTLSPVVASLFAQSSSLGAGTACFAIIAFTTQIYCDFSGYTDIGRGCATLLGYTVPENFKSPYQSAKVSDFWERWHISLSSWLRDYLYIPLGGSRVPAWRVYVNLMITMGLGGLWHGASWHFLVWGSYQGAILCANRLWDRTIGKVPIYQQFIRFPLINFLRRPITFLFVCAGWVFFRADTLQQAGEILHDLVATSRPLLAAFPDFTATSSAIVLLAGASVVVVWGWVRHTFEESAAAQPVLARFAAVQQALPAWLAMTYQAFARPVVYVAVFALVIVWPQLGAQKFIYFQF